MFIIRILFSSLKNHGVELEADEMFDMGAETFRLPTEEKMKFSFGDGVRSAG